MFRKNGAENKDVPLYGVVDERTREVVNQGDAYAGRFMLFAVLIDVIIRGFMSDNPYIEANWDLISMVIIGGLISTAYQVKSKVIFNRPFSKSILFIILLMVGSGLVAFSVMLALGK